MDESLTPLIALADDAHQAWAILEDKFDRKTVTNLHSLLKAIFNLKCTNKREVSGHIAKYDELWQRFTVQTRTPPKDNETSSFQIGQASANRSWFLRPGRLGGHDRLRRLGHAAGM